MGRGTFRSQNKVGETMSFQTNSDSGTTFDPTVTFLSGSDRVSWDLGIGNGYIADNTLVYTYPDTGTTKTVTLRTNKLSDLKQFQGEGDNIVGNLDMSGWDNLGGTFYIQSNSALTSITHPTSTETFNNYRAYSCNLDYVDFLPLSGATITGDIQLQDNSMSVTDVNHILVDFDNISTNLNPSGWTGTTLNISGTNAAPDSSSGGFDGIAALSSLTGGTNNWTITTS